MKHFNDNQPCVIVIATNGLSIIDHMIYEIVILPLSEGLQVTGEIPICNMTFRVDKQEKLSADDFAKSQKHGIDQFLAATIFERWYAKLNLKPHKRILPITYNWVQQAPFIEKWLGYDEKHLPMMPDYFSHLYRDILPIMLYWSELADLNNHVPPFPKTYLRGVGRRLGVPTPKSRTLLDKAFYVADVYDKLMSLNLDSVDLPLRYPSSVESEVVLAEFECDPDGAESLAL